MSDRSELISIRVAKKEKADMVRLSGLFDRTISQIIRDGMRRELAILKRLARRRQTQN